MRTSHIKRAMSVHPKTKGIFGGVFARNRVPKRIPAKTVAYIVNTDPDHKPGQHWIALYITKETVYYFDPYGLPPQGFHRVRKWRKRMQYFKQRLQGRGRMCGHYCLYFILSTQMNLSFNVFGSDLNANDRLVYRLVKRHLPIK